MIVFVYFNTLINWKEWEKVKKKQKKHHTFGIVLSLIAEAGFEPTLPTSKHSRLCAPLSAVLNSLFLAITSFFLLPPAAVGGYASGPVGRRFNITFKNKKAPYLWYSAFTNCGGPLLFTLAQFVYRKINISL